AEVGVGTLIVFIAMVLVAAVAAAVLINTTGTLQQRAQSTGKEATQEVSSNLKVTNVYGTRNDTTTSKIDLINIDLELSAGAVPVDLTKLILRYSDGQHTWTYAYGNNADGVSFTPTWVRGTNNSAVMSSGDLVQVQVYTWPAGAELDTRTPVSMTLIPEIGSPVSADFKSPSTFGTDKTITLR
ncbi:MAG: archaeal flagellin FlaB, partial [Thermoplasmata archaeon]|nr:archaeal flagellin FlaB [Thermoplasmata archaeon]